MIEILFWMSLILFLVGVLCIGKSFYSFKKRKIQTFAGKPEISFELDSKIPLDVDYFWLSIFFYFVLGIIFIIVGLYGLFFL
jgi:hypothetical protein